MISRKARVLACAGISAMLCSPAPASAQHVHGAVVVHGGYYAPYYYRPYFYPYYYSPFYFGLGWGGFYGGWGWGYPYYAGYPYPYPYPPYSYSGYWASARIEMKPRDAQVYLDGYYVGVVDQFDGVFQRLDIPGGEHELTVYMPGYHTLTERTVFRPGQSYHFKENLQPLPPGSAPEPKPQPDPNAVQRNAPPPPYGQPPYGQSPYPQQPPPPEQAPYPQQTPYPQQPPPPPQSGEPRMEPVPPPPPQNRGGELGTLNLRVQPEDAAVTIDGERWDSPQGGSRLTVQLAPGAHRIEVRKDGFRTYTSTIQIRPGEQQALSVSLPPGN